MAASPSRGEPVAKWQPLIAEASSRFGVPENWIRRVMRAESGGRTSLNGRPIASSAGALGLMQVMPQTWRELRSRYGFGADPHDPRDNILAGTAYLREMYERFGYPGLFAAYNAGPARYAHHLRTGRRLPAETVAYVAKVARIPARSAAVGASQDLPVPEAPDLFVAVSAPPARTEGELTPPLRPPSPLFVRLSAPPQRVQ
ncbi:MAG TPA: lytic transglycosylase domain-containing protein [Sphingomonadaceae bacterium]|nr:lytic transglycosylase domain-containing protein [Sphingomonadaceae bacterium]